MKMQLGDAPNALEATDFNYLPCLTIVLVLLRKDVILTISQTRPAINAKFAKTFARIASPTAFAQAATKKHFCNEIIATRGAFSQATKTQWSGNAWTYAQQITSDLQMNHDEPA